MIRLATFQEDRQDFYRAALGSQDHDLIWTCGHEHPTREEAIACAEVERERRATA